MIIHFLYIQNYRALKDQGFNFGGQYRFEFNSKIGEIVVKENPFYLPRFFNIKSIDESLAEITNVSAIIGENGIGKTSILDFLKENFVRGMAGTFDPLIVAFTTSEGRNLIYYDERISVSNRIKNPHGFQLIKLDRRSKHNIDILTRSEIPEFSNLDFVYFSNIYDNRGESSFVGLHNISTNYLLNQDYQYRIDRGDPGDKILETQTHRHAEIHRQLNFLNSPSSDGVIPFPLPEYLAVSLASDFLKIDISNLNFQTSDMLDIYGYKQVVNTLARTAKLSYEKAQSPALKAQIVFIANTMYYYFLEVAELSTFYRASFVADFNFDFNQDLQPQIDFLLEKLKKDVILLQSKLKRSNESVRVQWDIERFNSIEKLIQFLRSHLKDENSSPTGDSFQLSRSPLGDQISEFFAIYDKCYIQHPFLNFNWRNLSTGEKAMLSVYSRFYSISDEVIQRRNANVTPQQNLIILIDEGEIYMHPNWQKNFVTYLLEFLPQNFRSFSSKQRKIQIILASNSPFIASDLPSSNITFLKRSDKGKTIIQDSLEDKKQTFAANIHTLLSDSFFMSHGTTGSFAIKKIDEILELLSNGSMQDIERERNKIEIIINAVGEPIIKTRLLQLLQDKAKIDLISTRSRIHALESELKRIKKDNDLK